MSDEIIYIDMGTVSMLMDALEDEYFEIIEIFISTSRERIAEMVSKSSASTEDLLDVVHVLKGSSGNVGAIHLSNVCNELESMLRSGSVDGIDSMIQDIEVSFDVTCKVFQEIINGKYNA
ncbi:MAG: Hpt domain-containing protein [Gammaproteobacteria bacterium]|nr:Hpt domain-containing protein [Gammaproteobacteria bacterium]